MNDNQHQQVPFGLVDDTSIFIGLTSLPIGREEEMNFNSEIKGLVKRHKERTISHMSTNTNTKSEEFKKFLYEPRTFFIFGPFDLALVSLIDDFEFCTQAFHPSDPLYLDPNNSTGDKRWFAHHLLVGPAPCWHTDSNEIIELAKDTFIDGPAKDNTRGKTQEKPLPLFGICQLKLNNGLLIGAGVNFLRCVIKAIKNHYDEIYENLSSLPTGMEFPDRIKDRIRYDKSNKLLIFKGIISEEEKTALLRLSEDTLFKGAVEKLYNRSQNKKNPRFQLIILESWAWHEITLLLFSTSYGEILKFIIDLREMTVGQLKNKLNYKSDILSFNEFEEKECLIKKLINKKKNVDKDPLYLNMDLSQWHLFWNSTTTLGFRFEIIENGGTKSVKEKLQPINQDDYIYPFSRWYSKAGHSGSSMEIVVGEPLPNAINKVLLCTGRGDIIWPRTHKTTQNLEGGISRMRTEEFINKIVKSQSCPDIGDHILSTNTIVSFGPDLLKKDGNLRIVTTKPELHRPLVSKEAKENLTIPISKVIEMLYTPIRKNLIAKVVATRVFNTIALFNEGVDDPFLLSNFLELLPYVKTLMEEVKKITEHRFKRYSLKDADEYLNTMVNLFNRAWCNRYFVSYRLGDISDFNLEYKGGVQQLVSAFDGAYKILSQSISDKYNVLAIVSGDPRIYSNKWSVELNYFDIFMPEFFIARATHEAGETFLTVYKEKIKQAYSGLSFLVERERKNEDKVRERIKKSEFCSLFGRKASKIFDIVLGPEDYGITSFFSNVYGDTFARRLTYGGDNNLFLYWFRNMALTDPVFWSMPNKSKRNDLTHSTFPQDLSFFRDRNLKNFLLRIFIQLIMADQEEEDKKQINLVSNYWGHYPEVTPTLLNELRNLAASLLKLHFIKIGLFQMNQTINRIVNSWPSPIDIYPDKSLPPISKYDEMMKNLIEGKVYTANQEDSPYPFHFLQSLFRAYLEIIRELSNGTKKDIDPLLYRDTDQSENGSPTPLDFQGKILYDRRGGTFLVDYEARRKYFRLRSAFIMSLWDLTAKWKFWMPEPELNKMLGRNQ